MHQKTKRMINAFLICLETHPAMSHKMPRHSGVVFNHKIKQSNIYLQESLQYLSKITTSILSFIIISVIRFTIFDATLMQTFIIPDIYKTGYFHKQPALPTYYLLLKNNRKISQVPKLT